MLLRNTESTSRPSGVLLDRYQDGTATVRLADNIRTEQREGSEGQDEQTVYIYDEVVFLLGPDRQDTIGDIQRNFDDWWAYGCGEDEGTPTLEDRINALEDSVMELAEIIIGGGEG